MEPVKKLPVEIEENERPRPDVLYGMHNVRVVSALTALLFSHEADVEQILEYLSLNRVMLGNGCFVISVSIPTARPENQDDPEYKEQVEACGEFASLVEEKLLQRAIFYMVPVRGTVVCILAIPHRTENSKHMEEIRELLIAACEESGRSVESRFGIAMLTAVSPMFSGASGIPVSYQRVNDMLEFHLFFGKQSGICTPAVGGHEPESQFHKITELENCCRMQCNQIISWKLPAAFSKLQETIERIHSSVPGSLEQFKADCFQYMRLLIGEMLDCKIISEEQLQDLDLFGNIRACSSEQALLDQLRKLLQELTEPYYNQLKQVSYVSAANMRSYLEAHCTDMNLTVTRAADAFQLSQAAFSGYYKRKLGVTPLEDLNRFRVKYACNLLENSSHTMDEIMHESGFDSISTMRRLFRKYCGTTPAQYRNNYRRSGMASPLEDT